MEPFVLAEVLGELVFILFFAVVFALPIYFMVALDLHMDKVSGARCDEQHFLHL